MEKIVRPFKTCLEKVLAGLNKTFKAIDKQIIKRKRKLSVKHVFYQKLVGCAKQIGTRSTVSILAKMKGVVTSHQAVDKFADKIKLNHIDNISRVIKKYFPKSQRFFAVDGSRLAISKSINDNDKRFKLTPTDSYAMGLLTTLYDINNRVPFACDLSPYGDERAGFLKLVKYLKRGDTVIFDRGYFSDNMLKVLRAKNINFIFRLKKNSKIIKQQKGSDVRVELLGYHFRKIAYHIGTENYFLISNLNYKYNQEDILKLYGLRWTIETWYKFLKLEIDGYFYAYKTIENVEKKLLWQIVTAQLLGITKKESESRVDIKKIEHYQIGQKYLLNHSIDLFSHFAFAGTIKSLNHLFAVYSISCLSLVIRFRKYPRRTIIDGGKWYRRPLK